jgi:hypothetical protein
MAEIPYLTVLRLQVAVLAVTDRIQPRAQQEALAVAALALEAEVQQVQQVKVAQVVTPQVIHQIMVVAGAVDLLLLVAMEPMLLAVQAVQELQIALPEPRSLMLVAAEVVRIKVAHLVLVVLEEVELVVTQLA